MRKTIIIIISLISAFVLMSGGYGSWQKPLIITGKIKVVEPPPPVIETAPILDPNQSTIVEPEVISNPAEVETGTATESIDNPQDTDSVPVDQNANIEDESSDRVNPEKVLTEGEETSVPTPEVVGDVRGKIIEEQKKE